MKIVISQGFILLLLIIFLVTGLAFIQIKYESDNLSGLGLGFMLGVVTSIGILSLDQGWVYDTKTKKLSDLKEDK